MSAILAELKQRATLLTGEEKARLALHLLVSLETADAGDIDEAWRAEAESRLAAVERGESQTVSAQEVFAKLGQQLP